MKKSLKPNILLLLGYNLSAQVRIETNNLLGMFHSDESNNNNTILNPNRRKNRDSYPMYDII